MTTRQSPPQAAPRPSSWNWRIWRQWLLINALAGGAAVWGAHVAFMTAGSLFVGWPVHLDQFILGALFGLILGVAQFIILKRHFTIPSRWIMHSAIAFGVVAFAYAWPLDAVARRIAVGCVIGVMQWLVLRRCSRGISWWILASGGSWIAADMLSQSPLLIQLILALPANPQIIHAAARGLLYAAMSGLGLVYVQRGILTQKFAPAPPLKLPTKEIFFASWIVAHGVGWAFGFGLAGRRVLDLLGFPLPIILEKSLLEAFGAAFVWIALWRQGFRGSFWWVIWNGIGAAAGVFVWLSLGFEPATGLILHGAVVALFQWLLLSQQFTGLLAWLGLRTVTWAGCLILVSHVGRRAFLDVGWGAGGLAYGLVTGAWLSWQLRKKPA